MKDILWVAWYDIREHVGDVLLTWALRALPQSSSLKLGVCRGLSEQRDYDRYSAYAEVLKARAIPFDSWREQTAWQRVKTKAAS